MIKKNLKILLITSLAILLPIIVGLLLWNRLPDRMPMHWNAAGEIDGWSSKPFAVFGMPLIMLGFHWLCVLATGADPKKTSHAPKMITLVLWIIPVLHALLAVMVYAVAMGQSVRVEVVMPVIIGLLLAIIGNYLPKCKQNYTIGIKIPWTLNSEENWNKTHRFAGWVWTFGGLAIMATGFFGIFWIPLSLILPMVLIPLLYSYILHRKGI